MRFFNKSTIKVCVGLFLPLTFFMYLAFLIFDCLRQKCWVCTLLEWTVLKMFTGGNKDTNLSMCGDDAGGDPGGDAPISKGSSSDRLSHRSPSCPDSTTSPAPAGSPAPTSPPVSIIKPAAIQNFHSARSPISHKVNQASTHGNLPSTFSAYYSTYSRLFWSVQKKLKNEKTKNSKTPSKFKQTP